MLAIILDNEKLPRVPKETVETLNSIQNFPNFKLQLHPWNATE